MIPIGKSVHIVRRAAVLIISMIFVLIFSALAVSMATLSGTNLQIAENQRILNHARGCAESGLEVVRFWLNRVSIPGTTVPDDRFYQIAHSLQNDLTSRGITNITVNYDSSSMTIPTVILYAAKQQSFSAVITQIDPETLLANVTGTSGSLSRTIAANFAFGTRANTVFDFAVASRGPLSLAGNVELEEMNVSVGGGVYIESGNTDVALSIVGNSQIAGDVSIVNPSAYVDLQGANAGIGGETGQAAVDNHVSFGVPAREFPAPDAGHFEQFVTNIVDSTTDTAVDATFENVRIVAGTNPTFSGNVTLRGVVFVETSNVVTFSGNATITGIIVGEGDLQDNSGTNQINFSGSVCSYPVTELPDEGQFAQLKSETGTFLVAPGFSASFSGGFSTLNGSIAASGIRFHGNAGGIIDGSLINFSDTETELTGNTDLSFQRSGTSTVPAGFVPEIVLEYDPSSYSEVSS